MESQHRPGCSCGPCAKAEQTGSLLFWAFVALVAAVFMLAGRDLAMAITTLDGWIAAKQRLIIDKRE